MRVYDFDGTVYDGESSVDFFLWSIKKRPRNLRLLPKVLRMLWRYKRLKVSKEDLFSAVSRYGADFLGGFDDITAEIRYFWDSHERKVKRWYLAQKSADDVFLSASPEILIGEIACRLGVEHTIASQIDIKTGEVVSLCYRDNKCARFREKFPDGEIDEFYTDSENDRAVFGMAKNVYLVRGDNLRKL